MRIHTKILLLSTIFVLPTTAPDYSKADSRKQYRIEFCKKKKAQEKWKKSHYAFATNAEGDRCGYSWNYSTKKAAIFRAIKGCERKAKAPCKIVFAK